MKKFLLLVCIFLLSNCSSIAYEETVNVNCLYINGANNNTPKMEEWFFKGVNKLHPKMKNSLENSDFVRQKMLKNGKYSIKSEPMTFFWGDKTLNDLATVTDELKVASLFSPFLAQMVRTFFAHCMHDAIWVQKEHNMQKIIKDLHKEVKSAHEKGEKVILFGYSAGSFVTYGYLFHKLPAISWEEVTTKIKFNKEQADFIKQHKFKETCIDAITTSRFGIYSTYSEILPNPNFEEFKSAYLKLDKYTEDACIPKNTVLGTINYASPLVLFYSDLRDPLLNINKFNKSFFTYMKDNDMFWLTVNFADDPLGYPVMKNLTDEEISELYKIKFDENGRGFYHDKSDVKSPATFLGAHTSYWNAAKKFSKAVADAYKEGYLHFYPDEK